MRTIDALLVDYAFYHRTRGNLMCHAFGITLIVFGILSLLLPFRLAATGPLALWSAAEAVIAAVFLFELSLDIPLALSMLVEASALDLAARGIGDWRAGLAAFALGWIFQAVGHARYEKTSPAFFQNLVHLLVGPLFLLNELLRIRRVAEPEAPK